MPWTYEYDNDTGPRDEGFWEWYNILRDGETVGRMKDEKLAAAVCSAMNTAPELLAACDAMIADVAAYRNRGGKLTDKEEHHVRLMTAAIARVKGVAP